MAKTGKSEYLEKCKKQVHYLFSKQRILVQYVRDKKNRKTGVIIAYMNTIGRPTLRLGWSKCHMKLDEFNKYSGILKAYDVSTDTKNPPNVHSMNDAIDEMINRARRYFKVESSVAQ